MKAKDLIERADKAREQAVIAIGARHALDMALIATFSGSAEDVLANLGKENADIPPKQGLRFPEGYTDAASIAFGVGLDGTKVTIDNIPSVGHDLTFLELGLNNVQSSHVRAFAADVRGHTLGNGDYIDVARIYVRFKGGPIYRYFPLRFQDWVSLVTIARQMGQSLPTTYTVGEYIERVVKHRAESKPQTAVCEMLDPITNQWVVTLNKRQKAELKGTDNEGDKTLILHEALMDAVEIRESIGEGHEKYKMIVRYPAMRRGGQKFEEVYLTDPDAKILEIDNLTPADATPVEGAEAVLAETETPPEGEVQGAELGVLREGVTHVPTDKAPESWGEDAVF